HYLRLGVPITLLFQLFVRRLPIRALWVQGAPAFRLGWKGTVIAVALALLPLSESSTELVKGDWTGAAYGLCGIAGAVAAAYSLRHFHRESLRPLALCLVTGLVFDVILWIVVLSQGYIEVREVEGGLAERVV